MKIKNIRDGKMAISGCLLLVLFGAVSCKKMLAIDNPVNEVTTSQVFSSDILAEAAISGIYSTMMNASSTGRMGAENGSIDILGGALADDLEFFSLSGTTISQFQYNQLQSTNAWINTTFWQPPYNYIYAANSIIAGLAAATQVHDSVKNELTGEAEVVRAFVYFYLVNFFGNIPLVTTTNYQKTDLLSNASESNVYQLIVSDLKDAQSRLPNNYSVGAGERIVPTKYAAAALLARVYLYMGDWADAYAEADTVIASSLFSLVPLTVPDGVFAANSAEAIWQLKPNASTGETLNVTPEGYVVIPKTSTTFPYVYLTPQLLAAFLPGDARRLKWVDSTKYSGKYYYYPYKYQAGPAQYAANGSQTEYYMMLRLGEQFLIRAEAQAHGAGGGIAAAVSDLNSIRSRANVLAYSGSMDSTSLLDSIYYERRLELFAEWGNRWFDLKRVGQSQAVLGAISYKQPWSNNSLVLPIPYSELTTDPNLMQNTGY